MGANFFNASRSKSATVLGGTESFSASKSASFVEELDPSRRSADNEIANENAATAVDTAATVSVKVAGEDTLIEMLELLMAVEEKAQLGM